MKVLRIILLLLLLIIVVIAVGGFLIYNDTTQGPLPTVRGALDVSGLENQVEILRDEWGVPHIYASTLHDLFFAQGYTHAQDRWWQMEFNRHIGRGAIQELTGANDDLMGTDMFIRTLGWYESAQRDEEALSEENRAIFQAFADGINAYILSRPADDLALEYRLLGITGVHIPIEPWTITDTLAWSKVMAWNLTDTYDRELTRAALLETVGQEMSDSYRPSFPFDVRPSWRQPEDLRLPEESLGTASSVGGPRRSLVGGFDPSDTRFIGGLSAGTLIRSNNWVAAGSLTESGQPMLANDPHRSEEHTSELQSRENLVCRLLLANKKMINVNKIF